MGALVLVRVIKLELEELTIGEDGNANPRFRDGYQRGVIRPGSEKNSASDITDFENSGKYLAVVDANTPPTNAHAP